MGAGFGIVGRRKVRASGASRIQQDFCMVDPCVDSSRRKPRARSCIASRGQSQSLPKTDFLTGVGVCGSSSAGSSHEESTRQQGGRGASVSTLALYAGSSIREGPWVVRSRFEGLRGFECCFGQGSSGNEEKGQAPLHCSPENLIGPQTPTKLPCMLKQSLCQDFRCKDFRPPLLHS